MSHDPGFAEQDAPLPSEHDKQSRTWAMAIHLSQFANFIVPTAGIIAPIVLWQMKKDEFPELEEHGKNVTNWLISSLIYAVVSGVLTIVFVGFLLLLVLIVLGVVYPIIGGIKANNGETWKYPGAIAFLK